jgi:DNA-directed RNA polymerase omega subunit
MPRPAVHPGVKQMPAPYSVDDFKNKIDSLYRLVIVGARRANQISKNESHSFGGVARGKKSTITAMEEVLSGRVGYYVSDGEDAEYLE